MDLHKDLSKASVEPCGFPLFLSCGACALPCGPLGAPAPVAWVFAWGPGASSLAGAAARRSWLLLVLVLSGRLLHVYRTVTITASWYRHPEDDDPKSKNTGT